MGKLKRAISDKFGMPEEAMGNASGVSLTSNREAIVYECKEILLYGECEIKLRLCDGCVTVRGEELTMKSFFGSDMSITGKIRSIELEGFA